MQKIGKQDQEKLPRHVLRRRREREQRRKDILAAAETLFARKGYDSTSIEEIAGLAEVSPGTVYFYFENKEDLLLSLVKTIGFELRQHIGGVYRKAQSANKGMDEVGFAYFNEFCLRFPEKLSIFFRESAGRSGPVEEQRKIVFEQITADIRNAVLQISGSFKKNNRTRLAAEVVAVSIVGVYEKLAYHYLLWSNQGSRIMDIAGDAVTFVSGGIAGLLSRIERPSKK